MFSCGFVSLPHPFPPPLLSFTPAYSGGTNSLPNPPFCSFLDDHPYSSLPPERPRNGSVFSQSHVLVYYDRSLTHFHASPLFYLFHSLCYRHVVLSLLCFCSSSFSCLVIGFPLLPYLQFLTIPTQLATTTLNWRSHTTTYNCYYYASFIYIWLSLLCSLVLHARGSDRGK